MCLLLQSRYEEHRNKITINPPKILTQFTYHFKNFFLTVSMIILGNVQVCKYSDLQGAPDRSTKPWGKVSIAIFHLSLDSQDNQIIKVEIKTIYTLSLTY